MKKVDVLLLVIEKHFIKFFISQTTIYAAIIVLEIFT